jgi:hypothetical protein
VKIVDPTLRFLPRDFSQSFLIEVSLRKRFLRDISGRLDFESGAFGIRHDDALASLHEPKIDAAGV